VITPHLISDKPAGKWLKEIEMKLNHIDLPVAEIAAVRLFFETHFELRCIFTREDGLTVLLDEDGLALTLSPLPQGEALKYPTGFHLGFNLDNEDELFEVHGRIVAARYQVRSDDQMRARPAILKGGFPARPLNVA
jgi:catechol 2,3-dioxygenase-like lactoylglutathione lyase family enzyme